MSTDPSTEKPHDKEDKKGRPSSCVFVASLDSKLKEDQLKKMVSEHFQKWGKLERVKVLRDNESRPYAFVQYTNDQDAQRAIKEAHNSTLSGRLIRCEPAKVNRTLHLKTHSARKPSENVMRVLLGVYGEIEQLVAADQNNRLPQLDQTSGSRQWYCQFAYRDDAIRAYAGLRYKPSWLVGWAKNLDIPGQDKEEEVTVDQFSIFVSQLQEDVTEEDVAQRFQRHGKICSLSFIKRPYKKFAFITFETETAAAAAVKMENHAVFKNKPMSVQYRELYRRSRDFDHHRSGVSNLARPSNDAPKRRVLTHDPCEAVSKAPIEDTACVKFEPKKLSESPPSSPSTHTAASSMGRSAYSASTMSHGPMKINHSHVGDFHPSVQMMPANMPCFYYVPRGFDHTCDPRGMPQLAPPSPFFGNMYDGFEGMGYPVPMYMWPQGHPQSEGPDFAHHN